MMTKDKSVEENGLNQKSQKKDYTLADFEKRYGRIDNELAHVLKELGCDDIIYENGRAILMRKGVPIIIQKGEDEEGKVNTATGADDNERTHHL